MKINKESICVVISPVLKSQNQANFIKPQKGTRKRKARELNRRHPHP
jgi:hypothetical protein